jgi:sigma-E factor negative regulatory protein RseC
MTVLSNYDHKHETFQDFSRPVMVKFDAVEEVGVIKGIEGIMAVVSIPRKSACEGCSLGICKPDEQYMEIKALNPVHANIGQKVKIVMKSHTYLKGSLIVYGIPALALITGAVIGKEVISPYSVRLDPDIVSAVTGFIAFAVSFIAVKLWSSRAGENIEARPVIEEIIE